MTKPIPILSRPGVKRDGTRFDGDYYVDAQWCRWWGQRPRKMRGYRSVTNSLTELIRGMHSFAKDDLLYLHLGGRNTLTQLRVDHSGVLTGQSARIPAAGYTDDINNMWQFAIVRNSVGNNDRLIAHSAPNLSAIASSTERPIWLGDPAATAALTDTGLAQQSGGVVVLHPYLVTFGNLGRVDIVNANLNPLAVNNTQFVTGSKLIYAAPIRGGGGGPAGLFWSLDSLLRASFTSASTNVFGFDTIDDGISVLSSQGVIEYNGSHYWPGVDRWYVFNGVVRELVNYLNTDYFFDNLNFAQRQKVFAFKVPRFHEIWWCYPRGSATECTHAIIYNVALDTWYDTALPDGGRCAGTFAKVYQRPFMVGTTLESSNYRLWQHEIGVDRVVGTDVQSIQSYFETHELSMLVAEKAENASLRVERLEPDFKQVGNLTLRVKGRSNSRSTVVASDTYTIPATAASSSEETIPLREVRRLMSFRIESDVAGGDYEMGKMLAHIGPADQRTNS